MIPVRRFLRRGLGAVEGAARAGRLRMEGSSPGPDFSSPNDASAWERIYETPVVPVRAVASPVARIVAEWTGPGEVVLEAGCGTATASAELAVDGRVIELCDFSAKILERAGRLFAASGLPEPRMTACDITRPLPWPDRAVDVVWSSGVLEHWTDEELLPILREMGRISRRRVISLVPHAGCLLYRLGKHLAEKAGRWPYGRELPRQTFRSLFEQAGLTDIREFTASDDSGPWFLGLTDPGLGAAAQDWWSSLPPGDPARSGQGYLLVTIGDVGVRGPRS